MAKRRSRPASRSALGGRSFAAAATLPYAYRTSSHPVLPPSKGTGLLAAMWVLLLIGFLLIGALCYMVFLGDPMAMTAP